MEILDVIIKTIDTRDCNAYAWMDFRFLMILGIVIIKHNNDLRAEDLHVRLQWLFIHYYVIR